MAYVSVSASHVVGLALVRAERDCLSDLGMNHSKMEKELYDSNNVRTGICAICDFY